ncbi:TlpA family protein disulfide reductase [Aliikangiella coralliicola]|uniref:TlpA family protein disulfide reductase n=1 Tax=Aliikangiella coralliicola TaxID=2592383 RepID=A0A545UDD5_9GAMM|nr:TlpA disulfide reductase family protein [Aliikangiella coralliicola]TQV87476.1 TlpA family protein disulfide reductase [Aliikangiella coralliicola]
MTEKKKTKIKSLLSWALQISIYITIFFALSWWQQKDMLPTGEQIIAPQFTLIDINGKAVSLHHEGKAHQTLIYFFAPWCSICHASIDNLQVIEESESYPNLRILVVALDWRSVDEVDEFLKEHKLTMPVLLGTTEVQQDYQINAFPSYYLLSENGHIISRNLGYSTELGLRSRLLIAE